MYLHSTYLDYEIYMGDIKGALIEAQVYPPDKDEPISVTYAPTEAGALEDAKAAIVAHFHFGSIKK